MIAEHIIETVDVEEELFTPIVQVSDVPDGNITIYPYSFRKRVTLEEDGFAVDRSAAAHPVHEPSEIGAAYFARLQDILPYDILFRKKVICVGCGGSAHFLETLARCGIGRFVLFDGDRFENAHLACNFLGTKGKCRPLSVFLYGPTGVGKSAVVEALVTAVNRQMQSEYLQYKPIDCTQFQDYADISRLIGAAPGYVGFTEPGVFACLERNPNTVFVFEEIEKASPNTTQVIMQALETGRQETNGKTLPNGDTYYDLSRSIVFFTSNVDPVKTEKKPLGFCDAATETKEAPEKQEKTIAQKISEDTEEKKKALLQTERFLPEVLGRMHAVIRFEPLSGDVIKDIAAKSIRDVAAKSHLLYITELGTDILQDFINATADKVGTFGVRTLRHAAEYYFGDVFREFSHTHRDYETITVSGDLKNIVIRESENRQEARHA